MARIQTRPKDDISDRWVTLAELILPQPGQYNIAAAIEYGHGPLLVDLVVGNASVSGYSVLSRGGRLKMTKYVLIHRPSWMVLRAKQPDEHDHDKASSVGVVRLMAEEYTDEIPGHLLVKIMPDGNPTNEEWDAMMDEFAVGGSCGCDGYYDSGCPACNPEKRLEWVIEYRDPPESIFD